MNELIERKEKWEVLYAYILTLNYGDIISHKDIAKIINEPYKSRKYQSVVDKTKWKLLEANKTIKNIVGQGYKVLEPDEYTDYSLKFMQQGLVDISKSDKIQRFAPVNQMSLQQRMVHNQVSDRTAILKAHMSGATIEVKMLAKNPSALLEAVHE